MVLIKPFPLAVPLTAWGRVMSSKQMEGCLPSVSIVGWGCIFWRCFFPWISCQDISSWIHWDQRYHVREKFIFQAGLIIDLFTDMQPLVTVVEKQRTACMWGCFWFPFLSLYLYLQSSSPLKSIFLPENPTEINMAFR